MGEKMGKKGKNGVRSLILTFVFVIGRNKI
jgi:hypothetical protein